MARTSMTKSPSDLNGGGSHRAAASTLSSQPMEKIMNRILQVTDEDETLALEYIDLDDIRTERILPIPA
jgi:hypothetical protein